MRKASGCSQLPKQGTPAQRPLVASQAGTQADNLQSRRMMHPECAHIPCCCVLHNVLLRCRPHAWGDVALPLRAVLRALLILPNPPGPSHPNGTHANGENRQISSSSAPPCAPARPSRLHFGRDAAVPLQPCTRACSSTVRTTLKRRAVVLTPHDHSRRRGRSPEVDHPRPRTVPDKEGMASQRTPSPPLLHAQRAAGAQKRVTQERSIVCQHASRLLFGPL